jgi:hypothetical protein
MACDHHPLRMLELMIVWRGQQAFYGEMSDDHACWRPLFEMLALGHV